MVFLASIFLLVQGAAVATPVEGTGRATVSSSSAQHETACSGQIEQAVWALWEASGLLGRYQRLVRGCVRQRHRALLACLLVPWTEHFLLHGRLTGVAEILSAARRIGAPPPQADEIT